MIWFQAKKWLQKYGRDLSRKHIALFGSTGGIGNALCRHILQLNGALIMVDRNGKKASCLMQQLQKEFPLAKICRITADLEDINAVDAACAKLKELSVDILIHNAGAYSVPRKMCSTGYDNIFQINFLSPYYITRSLSDHLSARKGRVVVVGSIAHNYSVTDPCDIDFSEKSRASRVYGNAKRYWMYSAYSLAAEYPDISFSVVHPGITLTNITAHYPKWLFLLIKYPMKVIFLSPRLASLNIVYGLFQGTKDGYWIGPKLFNIWGKPTVKMLNTSDEQEKQRIAETAERIYRNIL